MQETKLSAGNVLDELLNGGLESDVATILYGPPGSGKTLICMMCIMECVKKKKNVIYVDTEGGFSVERLKQIDPSYEETLKHIIFLRPVNFAEQRKVFSRLKEIANNKIGLIVVDTISMLYRLELGLNSENFELSRELGSQAAMLTEIARVKNIPVLITNQVYSKVETEGVKMVGGELLKYGSKCLVELQTFHGKKRKATLRKHRAIESGKEKVFEIVHEGIKEVSM